MSHEAYMDEQGNLTSQGFVTAAGGLSVIIEACHRRAKSKGWWDSQGRNFGEMIALMHSELSEALEAYRDNDNMQEIRYEYGDGQVLYQREFVYEDHNELGKPVGVASELADVFIRAADTAAALHIPLVDAILDKHAYNGTRAHRHGGKKA